MKILVVTRLFTGMVSSVLTEKWNPKGLPSFYKFIEGLERHGIKGDIVFLCKRPAESNNITSMKKFKFDDMNLDFHVLPYRRFGPIRWKTAERFFNDISHLRYCARLGEMGNYDLIYCDQFDMPIGAFFALFKRKKVIARLFGVGSILKIAESFIKRLDPSFIYPSFFAPFRYIICTRDGSGERYFLSKYINENVPYEILLNGIDRHENRGDEKSDFLIKYNIERNSPIILFVGKMENQKGCREFLDAIVRLSSAKNNFYAVMVGEGPILRKLKEKAAREGISNKVVFTGGIEHRDIYRCYNAGDIYVSLNKIGNISNTVLEAISAGKCVVILSPSKKGQSDRDTHEVIPLDSAIRIERDNMVQSLYKELNALLRDKEKIRHYSEKSRELSKKILKGWEERIDYEVEILKTVAGKK